MSGFSDGRKPEQLPSRPPRSDTRYSFAQVAEHSSIDDGWIVVNNSVYDITNFVRYHPGFTLGGQASTVIAITRNLGKDCTEEFLEIHSRFALRQLQDYMIGSVDQLEVSVSTSVDLASFLVHIVQFVPGAQAALRLCSVSRCWLQAFSEWTQNLVGEYSMYCWAPLAVRHTSPSRFNSKCGGIITGVQHEQTAVLLGPRLWGCGKVVPTQVDIVLKSYRAPGCISFGVVPEKAFLQDPHRSKRLAHTFDGLGRLSVPGKTRALLFGERWAQGDHVSLQICQSLGQSRRVQGSLQVNGREFGVAFHLDADQPYSPVVYFYPMRDSSDIEILLPQISCVVDSPRAYVPQGLFFNALGPDLTSWLDVPVDVDALEEFTIHHVKEQLALRLTHLGPSLISGSQLSVFIDGEEVIDGQLKLQDCIFYRDGIHLERLHWHISHMTS